MTEFERGGEGEGGLGGSKLFERKSRFVLTADFCCLRNSLGQVWNCGKVSGNDCYEFPSRDKNTRLRVSSESTGERGALCRAVSAVCVWERLLANNCFLDCMSRCISKVRCSR